MICDVIKADSDFMKDKIFGNRSPQYQIIKKPDRDDPALYFLHPFRGMGVS